MDNFEYSLWVFHKDFVVSVLITAVGLFLFAFLVSAVGTSQKFRRALSGPDPAEAERSQYRDSLMRSLHREIMLILNGRRFLELSEDELNQVREIRKQYLSELRELGGSHGERE